MMQRMRRLLTLSTLLATSVALFGCDHLHASSAAHGEGEQHAPSQAGHGDGQALRQRPDNQVAVVTIWTEVGSVEATADFYEDVLGLRLVGSAPGQSILDTDGTFLVVMEGRLEEAKDTRRRWPMFALTVADLDASIEALRQANVELPWGVEEFGAPEPSSRYVMFRDPAGNLIELVEWL